MERKFGKITPENFQEIKQHTIVLCEKNGACEDELERLIKSKNIHEFQQVLIDNISWCTHNSIIDFEMIFDFYYFKMNSIRMAMLLKHQPQLIDEINTSILESEDILRLLRYKPQLIDKLDTSILESEDILSLLSYKPQLIDKIDTSKMCGRHISALLVAQPQLIDTLDTWRMSYRDKDHLLKTHPHLKEKLIENLINHENGIGHVFEIK